MLHGVTRRSAIKILTVLNGVSGNGLGKGTAGAFGACGATLLTQNPHVAIDKAFCMALGIGKYGNGAPMIVKSSLSEEILKGRVHMLEYTAVLLTIIELEHSLIKAPDI